MITLELDIEGKTDKDIVEALEHVIGAVKSGTTQGHDDTNDWNYMFKIDDE